MAEAIKKLQKILDLITLEHEAEQRAFQQQQQEIPFAERCQQGLVLYPIQFRQLSYGLGGQAVIELELPPQATASQFQPGQPVVLFSRALAEPQRAEGVIQRLQAPVLQVMLNSETPPEWLDEGKLGLEPDFDTTTYREMQHALQLMQKLSQGRLLHLRDVLLGLEKARHLPRSQRFADPGLNPSQQAAVQQVLEAEDLALIHGPPGTGKTTTLVAAIAAVLQAEPQVLVSAPSNTAVDLLVRKLAAQGLRVLRLGHPARLQQDIWDHTLDAQLEKHPNAEVLRQLRREMEQTRRQAGRYRRQFGPAERQQRQELWRSFRAQRAQLRELEQQMTDSLLEQAQVIACTLVGASQYLLRKRRFRTVFIDEAAQAIEGACWIPVQRAERVVMAGDHQQLPPTIHSREAQALAETLFEKCIAAQPQASTLLDLQYRMHEAIMLFPNEWFYENRLQAHASVAQRLLNPALPAEHPLNQPTFWIDTAGCGYEEQQDPLSMSYSNPEEGQLLIRWLSRHLEDPEFNKEPISIGVIAPYRAQVDWLKAHLPGFPRHSLQIETVDSFQGQERDLIVISLVRSNDRHEIGFLADLRRMNVAITRARKQVVLIGDSATLGGTPFYAQLQSCIEAQAGWRSAWEFIEY